MRYGIVTLLIQLIFAAAAPAQEHEHHDEAPADTSSAEHEHHGEMPADTSSMEHDMAATAARPLGIPMERDGSGTAWLPDASPMYASHSTAGDWDLMLHGNAFLQFVHEGGDRGDSDFGVVNWVMGMASRPVGAGNLGFRGMLSAEPITVGKCGYPDLLATGEFCDGEPLHDRQHPHDVFMELAARYQLPLGRSLALDLYGGPAGEPALGPVAYPHRVSSMSMPLATIGHHWQDASHISFGVATAGVYDRRWKVEGSLFNGREPDEERFNFDFGPLDSYSGRVWLLPNDHWAIQTSVGRLTEAEAPRETGEGRIDVTRATASVSYHQPRGERGFWTSTLVWGQNRAHGLTTDAFLFESDLNLDGRNVVFGRGELARKSGEDLVLKEEDPHLAHDVFTVAKVSVGYAHQFEGVGALLPALGAQVALSALPSELEEFYGSATPIGIAVFLSLKPSAMRMAHMPMQEMHGGDH